MRLDRIQLMCCLLCLGLVPGWNAARAGTLEVRVDSAGAGVADAVVSLHSPQAAAAVVPETASIDQRDTQFVPRVSVVQVGSPVRFPNSDNVRHQVYSFSPARRFELPLYSGKAAAPVVFGTPGVVELGCNIHDWMLAYVVVVDTPYHAITDADGHATLEAPAGTYRLRVWHSALPPGSPPEEREVIVSAQPSSAQVTLALVARVAPAGPGDDRLRLLQEKFRKLKGGR